MTEAEWLASTDPAAMMRFLTESPFVPAGLAREAEEVRQRRSLKPSDRKLRLFACACVRQAWHLLTDPRSRKAVEVAERYADDRTFGEELIFAVDHLGDNLQPTGPTGLDEFAAWYVSRRDPAPDTRGVSPVGWPSPTTQADLLRCVVGNPFRPVMPLWTTVRAAADMSAAALESGASEECRPAAPWLTPTVLGLATAAYEERVERLSDEQQYAAFTANIGTANFRCLVCGYVATGKKIKANHRRFCAGSGTLAPQRLAVLADALEEAGCDNAGLLAHLRNPGPHVRGCWAVDLCLGRE